jgi:MATE family multidrug resistance protein
MPAVGISVACTAIVGKYIGMGRHDIAQKRAWLALWVAAAYMGLCGLLFVVFRADLVRLFIERDTPPEQAAELVRLGSLMLIACACFQLFDAAAMVMSGALRGAGDTVFPGVATMVASWVIIVGGGSIMVKQFPGLESLGPWIAAAVYIFSLCVLLVGRFMTGKWKAIRLLKRGDGVAGPESDPSMASAATTDGIM